MLKTDSRSYSDLKTDIMKTIHEIMSKEELEEVRPLILRIRNNITIVRVPHTALERFKEAVRTELPFLKIVLVSGTLKSIRERTGISKIKRDKI